MNTDDQLVTTRQACPMFGYEPAQHRACNLYLERAGVSPWRDPNGGRKKLWWMSDLLGLQRRGNRGPDERREQPESASMPVSRFRKPAA